MSVDTALETAGGPAPAPAPTAGAVAWAPVPRVNLLPPEIVAERVFRRARGVLGGVVLTTLVLMGTGYTWALGEVQTAQEGLDDSMSRSTVLSAQKAEFAAVPLWRSALDDALQAREQAMARDVGWSAFLDDLANATPDGIVLDTVAVELAEAPAAGQLGVTEALTPLTAAGLGKISLAGTAPSYAAVATWMERLERVSGLDLTVLGNAAGEDDVYTFTGEIVITRAMLSHRYDQED